jgi:hypothetical protein
MNHQGSIARSECAMSSHDDLSSTAFFCRGAEDSESTRNVWQKSRTRKGSSESGRCNDVVAATMADPW